MFIATDAADPLAKIESALLATIAADAVEAKIRGGVKAGTVTGLTADERLANAISAGLLTPDEADVVKRAKTLADAVIEVDDFAPAAGIADNAAVLQALARAA
jgi:acyl-CoA dehydrogenase